MSDLNSILGEPAELPQETTQQEAPAQEAQPAADAPEAHAQAEEPKVVPLAALHEERGKRREMAAQLEAERRAREDIERRVEARLQALAQARQQPEPEPPAIDENPIGHLSHKLGETQAALRVLAQQSMEDREASHQAAMQAQLAHRVTAAEVSFAGATPDYGDALKFLHSARSRELQAFGVDEMTAAKNSAEEMRVFAMTAAAQGRNPAEVAYALAKAKGYTAKAQAKVDPAEKMAAAQRGVAASQSLGNGGGGGDGKLTAKQLVAMSDEEFAKATAGGNWAKLMGAT